MVEAYQYHIAFRPMNGQSLVSMTLDCRGKCKKHFLNFASKEVV